MPIVIIVNILVTSLFENILVLLVKEVIMLYLRESWPFVVFVSICCYLLPTNISKFVIVTSENAFYKTCSSWEESSC